jgi:hypothetical protein
VHGSVQVEKQVSKSCISDLLTWISGENTQFSCNHGFDVGSITPSATGVEVFRATSEKQRNTRCLQAIHQNCAVNRSGEYRP